MTSSDFWPEEHRQRKLAKTLTSQIMLDELLRRDEWLANELAAIRQGRAAYTMTLNGELAARRTREGRTT